MLEKIDLSKTADKETYKAVRDQLGAKLGLLQRECKAAGIPVIIVFEGMGAAGKGIQINRLIQNLDSKRIFCVCIQQRDRGRGNASVFVEILDENPCQWEDCCL